MPFALWGVMETLKSRTRANGGKSRKSKSPGTEDRRSASPAKTRSRRSRVAGKTVSSGGGHSRVAARRSGDSKRGKMLRETRPRDGAGSRTQSDTNPSAPRRKSQKRGAAAASRPRRAPARASRRTGPKGSYSPRASQDVEQAMHEMKRGELRLGRSGKKVTSRKQAIAIGLAEARREGAEVPPPRRKSNPGARNARNGSRPG